MPHSTTTRWLRRSEVAERLGISVRTLRRMEAAHPIPTRRVGRQVRYDDEALSALEAACPSKSAAAPVTTVFGFQVPLPRPARRQASASDAALELMTQSLRQKKQERSRRDRSG